MTDRVGRRRRPAAVARTLIGGASLAVTLLLVAEFASTQHAKDAVRHQEQGDRREAQEPSGGEAQPAPSEHPVRIVTIVRRYVGLAYAERELRTSS
ncbi:hypothetical protein [Streptomyces sp. NPDC005181]|uniref:hypothetical protein n=1 Tax=Streptomyces sp. NPDC005181 TaxID=3156869 RepID=UPI00339E7B6E